MTQGRAVRLDASKPRVAVPHGNARRAVAAAVAAGGVLVAGCGGGMARHVENGQARLPRAVARTVGAPGARLTVVSPSAGVTEAGTFTARALVSRFRVVRPGHGVAGQLGVGHLHFSLDSGRYDQPQYSGPNGRLALRLGVNGFYSPAYRPSIVYRDIPAGAHTLRVELVSTNDRATGVTATVKFHVR